MAALIAFTVALCGSLLIIPLVTPLALRFGLLDHPSNRKVHRQPIPRTGGWGIVVGAMMPVGFGLPFEPLVQAFMGGVLVLFLFGLWDDARDLNHRIKFTGQITAAVLIVYVGDLWVARLPFMVDNVLPADFGRPFTVFALVGTMNALNHSDGLDGLAGGESLLSLGTILALLLLAGSADPAVLIACAALGSTLGFLPYNRYPAQVFMGDTGSQYLGFTLGVLVVYLTQVADPKLAAASPLLLLGLPIFDLLATLELRIRRGMSWFAGSRNHFHHRLLDRGFGHRTTVGILWGVQGLLVAGGYFLRTAPDAVVIVFYIAVCGCLLGFLEVTERRRWQYPGKFDMVSPEIAEPRQPHSVHAFTERDRT